MFFVKLLRKKSIFTILVCLILICSFSVNTFALSPVYVPKIGSLGDSYYWVLTPGVYAPNDVGYLKYSLYWLSHAENVENAFTADEIASLRYGYEHSSQEIAAGTYNIYDSTTVYAVEIVQKKCKSVWGCKTMLVDGIVGYQTWIAVLALQQSINPHNYIP